MYNFVGLVLCNVANLFYFVAFLCYIVKAVRHTDTNQHNGNICEKNEKEVTYL